MFALCFEERILSSLTAVLKAGPGSSRCQVWPIGTQGEWACHWPPFWAYHLPAHHPEQKSDHPTRRHRSSSAHFVRCTFFFFFNLDKEYLQQNEHPTGSQFVAIWVTFSCSEIVLFSLFRSFLKLYKCRSKSSYNLPPLKEVPFPGHLYVNCVWFGEEKDVTCFKISIFISMNSLFELLNQRNGSCNLLLERSR